MKCPREFYYKYIAKMPEKKTIHLFRGSLVHKILERLFKYQFKNMSAWEKGAPSIWIQGEFEKEYGTFDINIQDGTINHPAENGEADS